MSDSRKTVLVLGDWFIDENWVVVQRESALSSRTGKDHYQLLGNRKSRVYSFCGAARVARLLWWRGRLDRGGANHEDLVNEDQPANASVFQFHNDPSEPFDVVGVGRWAVGDDRRLQQLFLPGWTKGRNPFALTKPRSGEPADPSETHEPSTFDGLWLANLVIDSAVPSARVLRIYETDRSHVYGLQLRERFDVCGEDLKRVSESQTSPRNDRELHRFRELIHSSKTRIDDVISSMTRRLEPDGMKMDPIMAREAIRQSDCPLPNKRFAIAVIKDHGRGEADLIAKALQSQPPLGVDEGTCWFVTPRLWNPGTLLTLWKGNRGLGVLNVWLIGRIAISNWSVHQDDDDVSLPPHRWFADKEPRVQAVAALQSIQERTGAKYVIAALGGLNFLAISATNCWWYCGKSGSGVIRLDLSGRESAILASLAAGLSQVLPENAPIRIAEIFANAMNDGEMYVRSQVMALQTLGQVTDKTYNYTKLRPADVRAGIPNEVDALNPANVVLATTPATLANEPVIILSQASPDLEGYIELVPRRRRQVARLASELERFGASSKPRGHVSALLIAGPGSGKTFLAKQLARSSGLEFFELNLTHMSTPSALLDRFLTIVSFQNQAVGQRRALIFIDEVNARINSWPAYGQLLTVMSDGTFVSGGITFKLDHCAWLFAGTDLLLTEEELQRSQRQPSPVDNDQLLEAEQAITFEALGPGWDLRWCFPDIRAWADVTSVDAARHRSSKEPDFVSRLTFGRVVLSPRIDDRDRDLAEATRALRGVASIRRRYPHVTKIGRLALRAMRAFSGTPRDLERVIQHMTPPTETVTVYDLRLPSAGSEDTELVAIRD